MIDGELELILIIGGIGYIGSRLYQELIQSLSEPVRVYDKQCTSPLLKGAQWMQGDLKDPISIEQALHEADTVIYLAGGHYATFRQNQESMLGDLGRFLAVVACNPVKRLLYASNGAAGAVGKEFGEALLREHPYPAMAAEAENMVRQCAEAMGSSYAIMRLAEVYGPGERSPFRSKLISLLGNGDALSARIHVDDAVRILCKLAVDTSAQGIFDVCDELPVTQREFYACVQQIDGEISVRWHAPDLSSERMLWSLHVLRMFSVRLSCERVKKELGYTFLYPTMKEGLKALYVLEDHPWGKKY